MFERFTERARRAVVEAQEEARRQHHGFVYPDHLLAGLLLEGEGLAACVLESCGWTLDRVRPTIRGKYAADPDRRTGQIPFDPTTTKVLELALRETLSLGHNYIGTEHVLLGLCRLGEGEGAVFTPEQVKTLRAETIRILSGSRVSDRLVKPRNDGPIYFRPWEAVETPPRCSAGLALFGANFHCQSDADHDAADGHVEHGDGWTMRWES